MFGIEFLYGQSCVQSTDRENLKSTTRDVSRFESVIDFDNGDFSTQLDSGWYQLEEDEDNSFRWIDTHAVAYLRNSDSAKALQLDFYIPEIRNYRDSTVTITMKVDGSDVLTKTYDSSGNQTAFALLPKETHKRPILRIDLSVDKNYTPSRGSYDPRQLAVIVGALKLTASDIPDTQ